MVKRVLTAMSGGVDSSVAAALLMEQGYKLSGITLNLFESNNTLGLSGNNMADVEYARRTANSLGIEHIVLDARKAFYDNVIDCFIKSYAGGLTPNPCIQCNKTIKFKELLDYAVSIGNDYIATGHYANIEYDNSLGRYILKKAKDKSKDQTYVLYTLSQYQLSKTLLPLGGLSKNEVRIKAKSIRFINYDKPDSQDICFIKDGDYASFIENSIGIQKSGDFVDISGNVLGRHKGLIHYTIGQRKGLGISLGKPMYVVEKDVNSNTVKLGPENELFSKRLTAGNLNFIMYEKLTSPLKITAKTRYTQREASATVFPLNEEEVLVEFELPQRAVTPGQSVVFYTDDLVLGGGIIKKAN